MITTDRKPAIDNTKISWGMRFKAAREAMNLSEKDAAARLHLKTHIIQIIEAEKFSEGPPVIFMRGYIRSYGRMLNLSEKDLTLALSQLDLGSPAASATPAPSQFRLRENTNNSSSIWSTAFVALVLTGLVGTWWWNSHVRNAAVVDAAATPSDLTRSATPAVASTTPETPTPAALSTAITTAQATQTAPVAISNTSATPDAANVAATTEPAVAQTAQQPAATPAPVTNQVAQAPVQTSPTPAGPTEVATNNAAPAAATTDNQAANDEPAITANNTVASADDDGDEAPAPVKTHTSKNKSPTLADSEMSVPEEGLDNEASE